ncbi:MAG TPA: IPT/TIG domain-containing protein [Pyrinomonadaceae bacterium]|nr:IPT/TIG domain-containing protein [Pyrinomonadaceae bacterium]
MAITAPVNARLQTGVRFGLSLFFSLWIAVAAHAQSVTYRLHREASTTANQFQLKTANPDAAILAVQSANLKSVATGEYIIKAFDTQAGVPNAAGVITSGSTVTFELWMLKTASAGTMFPRVKLNLNSAAGASICTVTGTTALTTTLTKYTLTGTVPANVTMTASDRFYLWVGVNLTATTSVNNRAELDIEGTVNGNYDSRITVPLPTPPPAITSLSPSSALIGTAITINGTNFGATQGTGTVAFNGTSTTPTSWTDTSIVAPAPSGATTGPVVVTARGQASNGSTFTVLTAGTIAGTITRTSDSAPISGALVEALQAGIVKNSATTAANGTYTMPNVVTGTYDVRVSAIGYQTKLQTGITVTTNTTTTVNESLDAAAAADISYIYDESGRLIAMVTATETVAYTYDAAGNLLSTTRQNTNLPSIIEFTPNSGPIGTTVTIYGTGFSSTPSQNTVKFNGATATVTSAAPTQIVTSVPAGATTGPITVNTPFGLATSSASFTVTASAVPTITGFTPNIGTPSTAVTINGTNFEPATANNRVAFNTTFAQVNTATATSIGASVPTGGTSGRISVTTPAGKAVSSADFFIPPSPYTATDVLVTDRMALGDTKTVAMTTASKIGLVLFDATAGQRVSLKVNSNTIASCLVRIFNPNGSTLASVTANTSGGYMDTPLLPSTGTYTILIDPDSTNTGSINFTLNNASDVSASITPGGPAVTVTTTVIGQNAQITFSGTAAQRISLKMTNVTIGTNTCCSTKVSILNPGGTTLVAPTFVGTSGGFIDLQTLPLTGQYTILVDPQNQDIGSMTLTLYDVPADPAPSITPGGAAVTITTTVPGQNARPTFSGAAGQRISLRMTSVTIGTNTCCSTRVSILNPDGTTLVAPTFVGTSGGLIDVQTLAQTGTYAIFVDPQNTDTGSMTLTLNDVPPDITGTIEPGGAPVTVTTTVPGQNASLTFTGAASQRISLKMSSVTIGTSTCCSVRVSILKPDGTALITPQLLGTTGAFFDVQTLPATGAYTIFIDPQNADVGSMTLTLYDVPADPTPSITPGGAAVTVTTTVPGQNARPTFSGTAGQRISLRLTNVTIGTSTCCSVRVSILNPDGTTLVSPTLFGATGGFIDVQTLAQTGTYTIVVDPQNTDTGSATLTLNDVPADFTGTITPGGAAVTVTTTVSGQNASLTFSGTASQRVSLQMTSVTIGTSTCCSVRVSIKKPDGTNLVSPTLLGTTGGFFDVQTLPATGTYTIFVDPQNTDVGSMTLTLNDVPADPTPTITAGGAAVTVTTTVPGQNARPTFSGTAGQRISLRMTAVSIGTSTCCSTRVSILNPDGSTLVSPTFVGTTGGFIDVQTLATTGTYTIVVDPQNADTGSMTLTLFSVPADTTGTVTIGGAAVNVTITTPGQNGSLTFSGTSGQQATVHVTSNTMGLVRVTLLRPDGTQMTTSFTSSASFNLATQSLTTTGTYTITINPDSFNTGSMSVSVTNP